MEVGIRALKASLSRIIAEVERGRIIAVTHRGQVVARIVPAAAEAGRIESDEGAEVAAFDRLFAGRSRAFDVATVAPPRRPRGRQRTRLGQAIVDERR